MTRVHHQESFGVAPSVEVGGPLFEVEPWPVQVGRTLRGIMGGACGLDATPDRAGNVRGEVDGMPVNAAAGEISVGGAPVTVPADRAASS